MSPEAERLELVVAPPGGRFDDHPVVRPSRLRFDRPPTYEIDGEWNQAASAELDISLTPAALHVLVP